MAGMNQRGGAAGSAFGQGYVYVMKNTTRGDFKIGCTRRKPKVRRTELQNKEEFRCDNIKLLGYIKAKEMNRAETAGQNAVRENLRMVKDPERGNATDWFKKTKRVTNKVILATVKDAVKQHNRTQRHGRR